MEPNEKQINDLVMIIKQLAASIQKRDPDSRLVHKAINYLRAHEHLGDFEVLREKDDPAAQKRKECRRQADLDLIEHEKNHPEDNWRGRDHA